MRGASRPLQPASRKSAAALTCLPPESVSSLARRPAVVCGWFVSLLVVLTACAGCNVMTGAAMNRSGMAWFKKSYYEQARADFARAVIENPYNADYMANLARATEKSGNPASAEQVYRYALNVNPGHQPSYHGLAMLMKQQNRTAEAANLIQAWVATQPYRVEPHIEMAWLQRELGNPDGAGHALGQALQTNPVDTQALAHLGQYYEDTGQPHMALQLYQRSLQGNWHQPEVHSRVAVIRGFSAPTPPPVMAEAPPAFATGPPVTTSQRLLSQPMPEIGVWPTTEVPQDVWVENAGPESVFPETPVFDADPAHAPPFDSATLPHVNAF